MTDIESELQRLRNDYYDLRNEVTDLRRSQSYQNQTRTRGVLASAGSTAESMLKFIYRHEGMEKSSKPAAKLMLDELITKLRDVLPQKVEINLRTVQAWRNAGAHDGGADGAARHVDEGSLQVVNTALNAAVVWFFQDYMKAELSSADSDEDTEANPSRRQTQLEEWRELYWWARRLGELKLLDDKALASMQRKHNLDNAQLDEIRNSFRRDVSSFTEVCTQAVEDSYLEAYEADALEQTRIESCISAREAEKILRSLVPTGLRLEPGLDVAWVAAVQTPTASETNTTHADPHYDLTKVRWINSTPLGTTTAVLTLHNQHGRSEIVISPNDVLTFGRDPNRADIRLAVEPFDPADKYPENVEKSMRISSIHFQVSVKDNGAEFLYVGRHPSTYLANTNLPALTPLQLSPAPVEIVFGRDTVFSSSITMTLRTFERDRCPLAVLFERKDNVPERCYLQLIDSIGFDPDRLNPNFTDTRNLSLVRNDGKIAFVNWNHQKLQSNLGTLEPGSGVYLTPGLKVDGETWSLLTR